MERGDEPGVEQRGQRVGGPGDLPVVGVDDVGLPVSEVDGELHEVVIGRRHPRYEILLGQPGQLGAGPQHPDPPGVLRGAGVADGEEHDVMAGPGEGLAEAVDVSGDAADGTGRELPHDHQDPHRGARYPCALGRRTQVLMAPESEMSSPGAGQ
jgi:hypothetical protein